MSTTDPNSLVSPEPTDEQLMVAFQGGDHVAFATIYNRHGPGIKGYLCNRLHGALQSDADDLVQAVFARLAAARETYQVIHSDNYVSTFLYKTASALVKNHLRDHRASKRDCRRTKQLDLQRENPPLYAPKYKCVLADLRGAAKEAASREVAELLESLTPFEATVVRMKDLEGYTGKSAAEALGIRQTTFEWYYLKAHKRLKEIAAEDAAP